MTDTVDATSGATTPARGLNAGYRKLLGATTISNLGDGIGQIAYPWLASAITRQPLLVALVAVAQRLPWLVFTLPAGVITDRVDRRRTIVAMNTLRGALTLGVAFAVLGQQGVLPGPDEVDEVVGTRTGLYLLVLAATLLLGMAEVLADNSGQTFMPALVHPDDLEKANGRLWAAEGVANTFVGPPLGSLLLFAAFSLPFFVDAASFFLAAALVALIPGSFRAVRPDDHQPRSWTVELREGVRWLWGHDLLRPMAIILGLMNLASMLGGATLVLFAQEVLEVGPVMFTVLGFGFALGGIVAGTFASAISRRFGSGTCLAVTLGGSAVVATVIFLVPWWPVVMVMFAITALLGTLWNVITVSLRQTIIPPHLLGRVNSVYRFFAWGMMPVGAALSGLLILVVDQFASRDWALRSVWLADALVHAGLFVVGRRALTTAKLEAARAAVAPA
ncbi:MAG: MFS transporter [Acidimicrobiales bacterium]|nr:MFS transporter [Acidimicrobiales bacterium]MCB9394866.1 MFS transporter [Acidimicrobiaceae bacterium]